MIDLKTYCKKNTPSLGYLSLRELESRYGLKVEKRNSAYHQPFMTSFRIIFSLKKNLERQHNILIPDTDFTVEYSIDLMPDYQQHVDSHLQEHGKLPPEYQQTLRCYELFSQEIKEKMPKLPFCQYFFNLLGKATPLSYLYTTLDKMGKRPVFKTEAAMNELFPLS
jgi:hypothetical protein